MPGPRSRSASGHVRLAERRKGPVFYIKYRLPDGRQEQRALGPAWTGRGRPPIGYYTRRTAEQALREALADGQRGRLRRPEPSGATFEDAAAEWLRWVEVDRGRRHSTVSNYRNVVRNQLLPALGADTPLEAITTDHIDRYRIGLATDGRLAARTINKRLLILHAIFRRAQRVFALQANPVTPVERQPTRASGDFDVLTPLEVGALARAA